MPVFDDQLKWGKKTDLVRIEDAHRAQGKDIKDLEVLLLKVTEHVLGIRTAHGLLERDIKTLREKMTAANKAEKRAAQRYRIADVFAPKPPVETQEVKKDKEAMGLTEIESQLKQALAGDKDAMRSIDAMGGVEEVKVMVAQARKEAEQPPSVKQWASVQEEARGE